MHVAPHSTPPPTALPRQGEALGLYGLIVALILSQKGSGASRSAAAGPASGRVASLPTHLRARACFPPPAQTSCATDGVDGRSWGRVEWRCVDAIPGWHTRVAQCFPPMALGVGDPSRPTVTVPSRNCSYTQLSCPRRRLAVVPRPPRGVCPSTSPSHNDHGGPFLRHDSQRPQMLSGVAGGAAEADLATLSHGS